MECHGRNEKASNKTRVHEYLDPGHIPGEYQFTPRADLSRDARLNLLPTDKTIVIYCYPDKNSAQIVASMCLLSYDAWNLMFGVNGFSYESLSKYKYSAPDDDDYLSILGD